MDLDAFFAAVEVLEHPELAGKPLVVGGSPDGRGVVATASYEARRFGVHSAMSSSEARRRCPQAIFVRPDIGRYREHSRRVFELVRASVPVVEQAGLDEGYLDLSPVVTTAGEARALLRDLQARIRTETGLVASFGCGTSKVVAKIASDREKPAGLVVVAAGAEAAFLAPLALRTLPGIGPRSEERLTAAGLASVGDLAALDDEALARVLPGVVGVTLRDRARGIDPREVDGAPGPSLQISVEETFEHDILDGGVLREEARRMAVEVSERAAAESRVFRTVTVKLRYPDFSILSRSASTDAPTAERDELERLALVALERALADRPPPVRLLGVGVSRLSEEEQLRLPLDLRIDSPP